MSDIKDKIETLKNEIIDTAGDAAEAILAKLDDVLEAAQEKVRELSKDIDAKTEVVVDEVAKED